MNNNKEQRLISFDDITMAKARNGDMTAWHRIYTGLEKPMYSLALRMVGNAATAEDVVQDAFMKVMAKISLFRGESSFWWWVRRIVSNQCINYLRSRKRWVQQDDSQIESIIDDLAETPEFGLDRDMSKLLDRLPEQAQRVVYLYVVEGMTHVEIAELFGQSQSFSKSLVSRSLKQLKKWVDK
jgi:RNA polymerase sigma-70 factor (ECF subfamily)